LVFVLIGVLLLWFGYSLFFGSGAGKPRYARNRRKRKGALREGIPGAPRTCPVCSALLERGERVKSAAFPAMGKLDRLMHISGCPYCLEGERPRTCPVCGVNLKPGEFLIARMFEKPGRSHVHVLGCSCCRGPRSGR
jgi:predicted nucleic acid-binding Zn ribbon protein